MNLSQRTFYCGSLLGLVQEEIYKVSCLVANICLLNGLEEVKIFQ